MEEKRRSPIVGATCEFQMTSNNGEMFAITGIVLELISLGIGDWWFKIEDSKTKSIVLINPNDVVTIIIVKNAKQEKKIVSEDKAIC